MKSLCVFSVCFLIVFSFQNASAQTSKSEKIGVYAENQDFAELTVGSVAWLDRTVNTMSAPNKAKTSGYLNRVPNAAPLKFTIINQHLEWIVVEPAAPPHDFALIAHSNPTDKSVTLEYELPHLAADICITTTDAAGTKIDERHTEAKISTHNETTLDLRGYQEGIYNVKVAAGDKSSVTSVRVGR